jgi:hypothetical protein
MDRNGLARLRYWNDKRARETVSYLMPYWHVHVNVTENSKSLFPYTKCRFFR